MAGLTNRGKKLLLGTYYANDPTDEPGAFKLALVTSAIAPSADTNVMADLTEVAPGNGYTTGGEVVVRGSGFDTLIEDDANDRGSIQLINVVWTGSGAGIPASGDAPRFAVLMDDAAIPNVLAYFDLVSDRSVNNIQTLTVKDAEIRFNES